MIENALAKRNASLKLRLTVKSLIALGTVALAVLLPQFAHMVYGAAAGVTFLPMYLPVLLGGCLLGSGWGLAIGALSPVVSFLLTSAAGSPMPALARLPFMMAELAVFAAVVGLFSRAIERHAWMAFPAVIAAEVCGRAFFLLSVALLQSVTPFTTAMIWGQIRTGVVGLILNAVVVPAAVIVLKHFLDRDTDND